MSKETGDSFQHIIHDSWEMEAGDTYDDSVMPVRFIIEGDDRGVDRNRSLVRKVMELCSPIEPGEVIDFDFFIGLNDTQVLGD